MANYFAVWTALMYNGRRFTGPRRIFIAEGAADASRSQLPDPLMSTRPTGHAGSRGRARENGPRPFVLRPRRRAGEAGRRPDHHRARDACKMGFDFNAFQSKRGAHKEVVNQEVKASHVTEEFRAREMEIIADVIPGSAKRFGLRFGSGAGKTELAITNDDEFQLGDVQTSAVRGREDKHYRLQIVAAAGKLLVQANNRVQYEKALSLKVSCTVELFAEGGAAVFRRVELWEIK